MDLPPDPVPRAFTIHREFPAPRPVVWKAWTDPDQIRKWWGSAGCTILQCRLDLRPGGVQHYSLRTAEGQNMWGKCLYRDILPPEHLSFILSFANPDGGITPHPLLPTWPLEMLTLVDLAESGNSTALTVSWIPENAGPAEWSTFDSNRDAMQAGWTGTLDRLTAFLTSPT